MIVFFHGIPFVDGDDQSLAAFMCDTGNLRILFRYTFRRIDYYQNDICPFHCSYRTDDTVALQFFFYLALSSQPCSINKHIIFSIIFHIGINSISSCSCYI